MTGKDAIRNTVEKLQAGLEQQAVSHSGPFTILVIVGPALRACSAWCAGSWRRTPEGAYSSPALAAGEGDSGEWTHHISLLPTFLM
jgi:hypothetical protein